VMADELEPISDDDLELMSDNKYEASLSFSQLNTPMSQNPSKKPVEVSLCRYGCFLSRDSSFIRIIV